MNFKKIAKIVKGQDGAIWENFLFRFDHEGRCTVYDLSSHLDGNELEPFSVFMLSDLDIFTPHSNSVTFSCEYYCETDEFPLLFTNVYNNYAIENNRREGVCCVYRIERDDTVFVSNLIGIVEIDFVNDSNFWCSQNIEDIRPYGNFVVDKEKGKLYAFTMRDESKTTRYFSFNLPKFLEADQDTTLGIKKVTLKVSDIECYFDCEYHHFIQGACVENGKIYSLEGFTNDEVNPAGIRIISTNSKFQEVYIQFSDYELTVEPEFIDFSGGICYYCDHIGNLYTVEF